MLVVGDREAEAGTVAVRSRKNGDEGAVALAAFLERAVALDRARSAEL
jgi:threonyl-tRNA synthetase